VPFTLTSRVEPQQFRPLEQLADAAQELDRQLAVDHAVIEPDRGVHHRPRDDLPVADDWALDDLVHAEDRDLGNVDHRRRVDGAEHAGIRDAERAALDLVRLEPVVARAVRQIGSHGNAIAVTRWP